MVAAAAGSEAAEEKKKVDLYEILGAEKTDDQQTISKKYKKQALKYHPDRNRGEGQEAAAERFKLVADAYAVLSDPNRRRQYDLKGDVGGDASETNGFETVDVSSASWAVRFVLAQASKLGLPIPTSIAADVLSRASVLAEDEEAFSALPKLVPGVATTGTVKLSSAAFYRVSVDAATAQGGLVLAAKSKRRNDKFRLIVFDARGAVRRMSESLFPEKADRRRGALSKCRLFVLPVDQLLVGMPFPMASEEHLPPVCAALDTLEDRPAANPPFEKAGDYLVALYSDNLLSTVEFTLACAPATLDGAKLAALDASAAALRNKKAALGDFGDRFSASYEALAVAQAMLKAAEKNFNDLLDEGKQHDDDVAALRAAHDAAQGALLEAAFRKCTLPDAPAPRPAQPAQRLTFASAFGSRGPAPPAGPTPAAGLDL